MADSDSPEPSTRMLFPRRTDSEVTARLLSWSASRLLSLPRTLPDDVLRSMVRDAASSDVQRADVAFWLRQALEFVDTPEPPESIEDVLEDSPVDTWRKYLPEDKNQAYAFVAILVAVLTLLYMMSQPASQGDTNITINQKVEQIINQIHVYMDEGPASVEKPHPKPVQ